MIVLIFRVQGDPTVEQRIILLVFMVQGGPTVEQRIILLILRVQCGPTVEQRIGMYIFLFPPPGEKYKSRRVYYAIDI